MTIVSVDSWDGSESNYSTAESYAKASLLNFNPVAGKGNDPDNWIKSLIKLPVRREGDSKDTYVREAVFAASGGRGITQVKKPSEVSEEDFERLMKQAANELIKAYKEMDMIAPESVYDIAGKERPEEQAVSFEHIYTELWEALELIDEALSTYTRIIDCYISDDCNLFAIVAQNGKLFKQHFIITDEGLTIGDVEEIEIDSNDNMPMTQGIRVIQQENDRYRWLAVAATTALNRSGTLNSKKLYDSFIEHINETGEYPILNFYHYPNTRLGQADFAARDDNLYILSGTFDDNEYGIAAAKGIMNDPGYWGQSIEFWLMRNDWMVHQLDDGAIIQIPIFIEGVNDATSILPEKDAACLGTGVLVKKNQNYFRGQAMEPKVKDALKRLFAGNEALADEFESDADTVNQEINENMIHQSANTEEVVEEETVEEVETEIELDEDFIPSLLADLATNDQFAELVNSLVQSKVDAVLQELNQVKQELARVNQTYVQLQNLLSETEQEKRQRWSDDRPAKRTVSYRARQQEQQQPAKHDFGSTANSTLSKIRRGK